MLLSLALLLNSLLVVTAASDVVVYWGQNSNGGQQPLSTYCQSDAVDIVVLSFLYEFPSNFQLNFADACEGTYTPDGTLYCPQIGSDIKTCQSAGKKVLLSMGGASGAYGFNSDSQASDFATTLWNKFGKGTQDSSNRPFGDAVVDGFDFDIENNEPTGYASLATSLRTLFAQDTSKQYYLSAAPQCPYPDASVGDLMKNADLDYAFIQFYNNYCALGSQFNWDTWVEYAENVSPNKNIQLFVGLPGGPRAANTGYVDASTVKQYSSQFESSKYFGGFSLWDATSAWSNVADGENYAQQLKSILGSSGSSGSETSASSSAAASPTSTNAPAPTTTSTSASAPSTLSTVTTTSASETYTSADFDPSSTESTSAQTKAAGGPGAETVAVSSTEAANTAAPTSTEAGNTAAPTTQDTSIVEPSPSSLAAEPATTNAVTTATPAQNSPSPTTGEAKAPSAVTPVVTPTTQYVKGQLVTTFQTVYKTVATTRIVATITTSV